MSDNAKIEEKKTRLWALTFESTKQIVHCAKCGATNIVNRLVEDPGAKPSRRASTGEAGEVSQAGRRLVLEAQLAEARRESEAARLEIARAKKTIVMASLLAAVTSATCLALAYKAGKAGKRR